MAIFKRSVSTPDDKPAESEPQHVESTNATSSATNFKVSKTGDGDVALALFSSPDDAKEAIDPLEEKKVVRKIDFMILPYLAVCYA